MRLVSFRRLDLDRIALCRQAGQDAAMRYVFALILLSLAGCAQSTPVDKAVAPAPLAMRWDHRAEASAWTQATMDALAGHGAVLPALVPSDIDAWCPGYVEANDRDRRAFWAGLFSALAKHESTWNPKAVGGGGLWYGLVQIDPRTAGWHQCDVKSGSALLNGSDNLRCGVRIAANQVPKRGSISRGMRDWGPFHSESKRAEMSQWTRSQSYCAK